MATEDRSALAMLFGSDILSDISMDVPCDGDILNRMDVSGYISSYPYVFTLLEIVPVNIPFGYNILKCHNISRFRSDISIEHHFIVDIDTQEIATRVSIFFWITGTGRYDLYSIIFDL